jgi:small subunit ribosomal protein S13
MFYILGKRMEPSKSVHIALQAIFGIGKTKAIRICEQLGLSPSVKINQLKRMHVEKIRRVLSRFYITGSDLERLIQQDIKTFIKIGCYRGFRHHSRLPCRGQRTHTNAKTCRRGQKSTPYRR